MMILLALLLLVDLLRVETNVTVSGTQAPRGPRGVPSHCLPGSHRGSQAHLVLLGPSSVVSEDWHRRERLTGSLLGVGLLRCHVCEKEHSFKCQNPTECPEGIHLCASIALRMFARYYYVSKQCVRYCPMSSSNPAKERSFVLLKPTPFLYVRCCVRALCNTDSPELNETEANYYRESRSASNVRSSSAWLVPLLMLSPGLAGLRLP
ncbi:lymphocyte antigen 6K-like [Canis aureus]